MSHESLIQNSRLEWSEMARIEKFEDIEAWQERDYAVIVAVADKIPNNVLEEDPKLLM